MITCSSLIILVGGNHCFSACVCLSAVCYINMWPWMGLALRWAHREYCPAGTGAGGDRLVCDVLRQITLRWLLSMGDRWEGL